MNNETRKVLRFRGCFIGGPLDGQALPAHVQAGGVAMCRCEVPGQPGLVEVRYLHRRMAKMTADALEEVEFLVFDGLPDDEAAALVDSHRDRLGGWGDPVLTLPAQGFEFRPEAFIAREFDDAGVRSERLRFGVVTRLSPDGACIAAGLSDESRALSRDEMDPTRCGWCDSGIGHTISEHRIRVEMTMAEERAAEFQGPDLDDFKVSPLALAAAAVLYGPPAEVVALDHLHRAMFERTFNQAREQFIANREAEMRPQLVLP